MVTGTSYRLSTKIVLQSSVPALFPPSGSTVVGQSLLICASHVRTNKTKASRIDVTLVLVTSGHSFGLPVEWTPILDEHVNKHSNTSLA